MKKIMGITMALLLVGSLAQGAEWPRSDTDGTITDTEILTNPVVTGTIDTNTIAPATGGVAITPAAGSAVDIDGVLVDGDTIDGSTSGTLTVGTIPIVGGVVPDANIATTITRDTEVNTATQTALNLKAALAGAVFTGPISGVDVVLSESLNSNVISTGTTITAFGDSITAGTIGVVEAERYLNLLGDALNLSVVNEGEGSGEIADFINEVYGTTILATDDVYTFLTGYNDNRHSGATAPAIANYTKTLMAQVAYTTIPDSNKFIGQDTTNITYVGTWSNTTLYTGITGLTQTSSTQNDTADYSMYGSTLYIAYGAIDAASGGEFSVTVDTVDYGTYNCYDTYEGVSNLGYSTYLLRIPNLSESLHDITITVTSATGSVYLDWVSSNGGVVTYNSPNVFVGSTFRMDTTGYAFGTPTYDNASDTTVIEFNKANKNVADQLILDGLNVKYVNVDQHINLDTDIHTDDVHLNATGHTHLYDAFLSKIEGLDSVDYNSSQETLINTADKTALFIKGNSAQTDDIVDVNDYTGVDIFSVTGKGVVLGETGTFPNTPLTINRDNIDSTFSIGLALEGRYESTGSAAFSFWANPTLAPKVGSNAMVLALGGGVEAPTGETLLSGTVVNVGAITKSGTGVITNAYGINIASQTAGTNNYSLYLADTTTAGGSPIHSAGGTSWHGGDFTFGGTEGDPGSTVFSSGASSFRRRVSTVGAGAAPAMLDDFKVANGIVYSEAETVSQVVTIPDPGTVVGAGFSFILAYDLDASTTVTLRSNASGKLCLDKTCGLTDAVLPVSSPQLSGFECEYGVAYVSASLTGVWDCRTI